MKANFHIFPPLTLLLFFVSMVMGTSAYAQTASCEVYLTNDAQTAPDQIEFDICVRSTNHDDFPAGFLYGHGQYRIEFNPSIINHERDLIEVEVLKGSSELSCVDQQPLHCSFLPDTISAYLVRARFPVKPELASLIPAGNTGIRIARISMKVVSISEKTPSFFNQGTTADLRLSDQNPGTTAVSFMEKSGTVAVCKPIELSGASLSNKPLLGQ
ncbi:hypothetical protein TBC1_11887 [Lentimicrobium saccharophilum]|uniref:Uncharacterized protein n=1 Tax=Lentimicrobium saccharophilum TaxID=1678841 RepID=A0A0S7BQK9_9BACT|nr:hypothetical protein [Lentimicrobium saccharophilum]GAP42748.1 hypothetical protein TBC1_11887 [Lentimicrobium saccharophilum]